MCCSLILDRDCKKDEEILFYYDWNEALEFESVSIQLAMECPDVDSSVDDMKLDVEEEITTATILPSATKPVNERDRIEKCAECR